MKIRIAALAVALTILAFAIPSDAAQQRDRRPDRLANEKKKLAGTTNPERRAESMIRIADITLSFAQDGLRTSDLPQMKAQLDEYSRTVVEARDTMMNSGLDPYKKSKGYRFVEMSLRRQLRSLNDMSRALTFDERQPVEVIRTVTDIRDEFFKTIFR